MGIRKHNLLSYIVTGSALLIGGIAYIFCKSKIFELCSLIFLIIATLLMIYTAKIRTKKDEMAVSNYGRAYYMGFSFIIIALFVQDIINDLFDLFINYCPINTTSMAFICSGVGYIAVGLYFAVLDGGFTDAAADN